MRKLVGVIKDYPGVSTLLIAAGVVLHWALYDSVSILPDIASAMEAFDSAWSIYIGFAAIVAISAGFAGVIVVFALSSPSDTFSKFRYDGGDRLEANWVSPVATSLLCALGSALCAILHVAEEQALAWWMFEFVLFVAAASGVRLIWLFRRLAAAVRTDDVKAHKRRGVRRSLAEVTRGEDKRAS